MALPSNKKGCEYLGGKSVHLSRVNVINPSITALMWNHGMIYASNQLYMHGFMSTSIMIFIVILIVISSLLTPNGKTRKRKRTNNKNGRNRYELFTDNEKREAEIAVTTFDKKKIFNKGEYIALRYTNKYFADNNLNYYIFPQVPLMAFLDESDSNINIHAGLRPDFVIVNSSGDVVAVMEINGKGHRHKFDTSKFMILESVGIAVINVDTTTWNKSESYGKYVAKQVHIALNDYFFNNNKKSPKEGLH